jgi:hypothetical protein
MNSAMAAPFRRTFDTWPVTEVWQRELFNYIVLGFAPGSFHAACFANDLSRAAHTSHIMNGWSEISSFMKWLTAYAPVGSWGNDANVMAWLAKSTADRNAICTQYGLLLTEAEVVWVRIGGEQPRNKLPI